jgi:WS/DGAT C-terminal domain
LYPADLFAFSHHAVSDGQGLIQSYGVALSAIATGATKEQVQHEIESSAEIKKPGQRGVKPTLWGTISHGAKTVSGLYFRSRKSFVYGPNSPNHRVHGRRYAHSKGISLDDIKLIRQAFSTEQNKLTLNDVACALLSRSMGIAAKRTSPDGKVKDKRLAVFVPISIRPKGNYELANLTTGAIAWFKLNEDFTLEERLAQVNREMTRIKRSWLPKLWYNSFGAICRARVWFAPHYPLGKEFFNKAYREVSCDSLFSRVKLHADTLPLPSHSTKCKHSLDSALAVHVATHMLTIPFPHRCTNVPGPNKPVQFGEHVANRYFVMPPSSPGKATFAIGMISYAGTFSVAVSCDDVPEFERLCQDVCESFQDGAAELVKAARERLGAKKEAGGH